MKNEFRTAQRQHINISNYAYKVLLMDSISFMGTINMSGFINTMFLNFYQTADSSVSLALEREREFLRNGMRKEIYLRSHPRDIALQYYSEDSELTDEENDMIDMLVHNYASDLNSRYAASPKQKVLKIRLQNEVFDIIYPDGDGSWSEEGYYRSPGEYIRTMIEEYALKTYFDREGIFFREQIDTLSAKMNVSDSNKRILTITYSDIEGTPVKYNIKPHFLTDKPLTDYHYLIALGAKAGEKNAEYEPMSFRLSWITGIQERSKSFGSGKITKVQKEMLDELMQYKGASNIARDLKQFKIWLTPKGFKKYIKIAHMRPLPMDQEVTRDEEGNYIMHFRCSERQVFFFFFKLADDIKVIEPPETAERFKTDHYNAYKLYTEED